MTTPRLGAPELTAGQHVPETTVNEIARYVEAFATRAIVKDRDLATPPGSPADGDCYLVAASPTGAWSGQAGKLALRISTAWAFVTVKDGFEIEVEDEDAAFTYRGSSWVSSGGSGSSFPSAISTQSGTSYTLALGDAETHVRLTSGSAVTLTVPPNSSVAFPTKTRIRFTAAGAGTVTLTPGSGVTLNSRGGLLASAGQYAVFEIEKVATDTWDVIGDLA